MADLQNDRKIEQVVEQIIVDAREKGLVRLPPLSKLSRQTGFSTRKLSISLSKLKNKYRLTIQPGKGIFVSSSATPGRKGAGKWRKKEVDVAHLAKQIYQKVIGSDLASTYLPATKKLADEFGVTTFQVRAALEVLQKQNCAVMVGKRYKILIPTQRKRHGTIVFIGYRIEIGISTNLQERSASFIRALEQRCHHYELSLHFCDTEYLQSTQRIEEVIRQKMPGNSILLGVVLWTLTYESDQVFSFVLTLRRLQVPIAIFDETDIALSGWVQRLRMREKLYRVGVDEFPGSIVGNYLSASGHRNIAYVSFAGPKWATQRFAGLNKVMQIHEGSIEQVLIEDPLSYYVPQYDQISNKVLETIHESFLSGAKEQSIVQLWRDNLITSSSWYLWNTWTEKKLVPLLEELLKNKKVTAWVAANDVIGATIVSFLQQKRICVPHAISVCSFDDTKVATSLRFDSYDFGLLNYAEQIVTFLLQLRHPGIEWENKKVITLRGSVIQRGSVANATAQLLNT